MKFEYSKKTGKMEMIDNSSFDPKSLLQAMTKAQLDAWTHIDLQKESIIMQKARYDHDCENMNYEDILSKIFNNEY